MAITDQEIWNAIVSIEKKMNKIEFLIGCLAALILLDIMKFFVNA